MNPAERFKRELTRRAAFGFRDITAHCLSLHADRTLRAMIVRVCMQDLGLKWPHFALEETSKGCVLQLRLGANTTVIEAKTLEELRDKLIVIGENTAA